MVMTHESVRKTKKQQLRSFKWFVHDEHINSIQIAMTVRKTQSLAIHPHGQQTSWVTESCFEPLLFSIFANGILYVQKKRKYAYLHG